MYKVTVRDHTGKAVQGIECGSWRDHAAEIYGATCRKYSPDYSIMFIDTVTNEVLKRDKGRRTQ